MISKNYRIEGMTCSVCVAKVKSKLEEVPGVTEANISLEYPQARLHSEHPVSLTILQENLNNSGKYRIYETEENADPLPGISLSTYKPLLLIIAFITGISLLAQYPFHTFSLMLWMRHFMAGFFVVFAFFKLLNLSGFASAYRMYDIIAQKWPVWGFIYPFLELLLGISYLLNLEPLLTNISTALILGISSIGVIQSNLNKRKIKCACLGDVFNLPMSTVTIVEDLSMVSMAVIMILLHS